MEQLLTLSDETLAERAQRGDTDAFDAIVARHAPALYRFVARTVPRRSDCEDVVQEALIAAWKALPSYRRKAALRTWLFSIASRKTADWLRRSKPDTDSEHIDDAPAAGTGPFEQVADREFLSALGRELAHMPYLARAAWWLKEVDGLSIAEIATVLATSEGAVRGHLQRTRRRLAAALEGYRP